MELRRLAVIMATAAFGAGAALGVAACGDEEREGTVEIRGGTTGTAGTVGTVGTATAPSTTPTVGEPATVEEAPTAPETTPTSP